MNVMQILKGALRMARKLRPPVLMEELMQDRMWMVTVSS